MSFETTRLIVITGASGNQGSYLIPRLKSLPNTTLRLVCSSTSSRDKLQKAHPTAEVVVADLHEPAQLLPVLENATHAYHVGPGFHHHETQLGYNMIDAAVHEVGRKGNRFQHFIYSSVLNTQLRKLLNHDCKRYVEEYLYESGLNWTVLQPTNFMNKKMMLALYEQPREKTVFNAPWNPDKLFSMLALNDLAEVTETIVKEGEKHYMAQYPLVSTEKHTSYREAVGIFGKVMGREIEVKKMEYGEAVEGFLEMLFGGGEVDKKTRDVAQRMLLYYDNYALQGNPNIMTWLLGRKPTQLDEWAKMEIEAYENKKKASE